MNNYIEGFKYYLKTYKGASENTILSYGYDVKSFLAFLENKGQELEDLSIEILLEFISSLNEYSTKNRALVAINSFFKFLRDFKKIKINIDQKFNLGKKPLKLPEYLTEDEIKVFFNRFDLNTPEGIRDRVMVECLYSLGLRISEMINLRIQDIDIEERLVRVIGKGNKERIVPFGKILENLLKKYIKEARPHFIGKKTDFLFFTRLKEPFTRVGAWKMIKKYAKGIDKNIKPHMFRHSFATHLLLGGADLISIQKLLGHSNLNTTSIYTHLDYRDIRSFIDKYHPFSKNYEGNKE